MLFSLVELGERLKSLFCVGQREYHINYKDQAQRGASLFQTELIAQRVASQSRAVLGLPLCCILSPGAPCMWAGRAQSCVLWWPAPSLSSGSGRDALGVKLLSPHVLPGTCWERLKCQLLNRYCGFPKYWEITSAEDKVLTLPTYIHVFYPCCFSVLAVKQNDCHT